MRREDKERALSEVTRRVVEATVARAHAGQMPLDEVLAEAIYHERRRLKEEPSSNKAKVLDAALWDEVHAGLRSGAEGELVGLLTRAVAHYGGEIAGNFDERVYGAVTRGLPPALGLLMNAVSPKRILAHPTTLPKLDDALVIQGETEHLRRLHELGTVVLLPTHVSNMDSILVGFALYRLGLPPFVYGAGLNLFSNPLVGFFMHHLGAYTVDRKKRDPLYKEVLKAYAGVSMELGYDNIFFPGGTRSRSGAIERHLKLGLLGTSVEAYTRNLQRKAPKPRLFIVPATLSFELVLEAETLIDDFLKEVGKSRYIISDDEFSQPRRIFDFMTQLFGLDSKLYFTVGRGLDVFGNPVYDDGESLDPCGRRIDAARYTFRGGAPVVDPARDAEYTREVGLRVGEAFLRDNVIQPTNVLARAVLTGLRKHNPSVDLLRLLRTGGRRDVLELREVHEEVGRLLDALRALAARGGIRLDPKTATAAPEDIVSDGLRHFAIYHPQPAAERKGDLILSRDRQLLFYYQNRLEGYGLPPEPDLAPALTHDHRAIGARA